MSSFLFILFGLSSAFCFGTGDFTGGYITKNTRVFLVLLYSQISGFLFLLISIFIFGEVLVMRSILLSFISGIIGALGLISFYKGLSMGNMGIVAPITSVVTPIIPVLFSLFELKYSLIQIIGIIIALASIWLVSNSKLQKKISYSDVILAVVAGICFGFFLLFINLASSENSFLYPILFARSASILMIGLVVGSTHSFELPSDRKLILMALIGILDSAGNVFFILSSKAGRVDFASIILSLGPVITVLLAWKILKEKISAIQAFGIFMSLLAISLLSP